MVRVVAVVALAGAVGLVGAAAPQDKPPDRLLAKAVEKVSATFDPAEARPGQTVTFRLTVELKPGYHTYPLAQPDKEAANMVNTLTFPAAGTVVFVGKAADPTDFRTKAEPDLGIGELRYLTGKVTWTRKAVVSPAAAAGPATVTVPGLKLNICDKNNCFPPKDVPVEATLKVLDGPPAAVEAEFAEEVKKALGGK